MLGFQLLVAEAIENNFMEYHRHLAMSLQSHAVTRRKDSAVYVNDSIGLFLDRPVALRVFL